MCFSVLQCVAVCCSAPHVYCSSVSVLQCVAACCSVLQCVAVQRSSVVLGFLSALKKKRERITLSGHMPVSNLLYIYIYIWREQINRQGKAKARNSFESTTNLFSKNKNSSLKIFTLKIERNDMTGWQCFSILQ